MLDDSDFTSVDHDRYLPFLIASTASALTIGAANFYPDRFGIKATEWRLLSVMSDVEPLPAREICARANLDKAAVSRSLKVLEDGGYVTTVGDRDDARRRLSVLTPEGRALYGRVHIAAREREEQLLDSFSPAEVDTLIGLLQRVKVRASDMAEES